MPTSTSSSTGDGGGRNPAPRNEPAPKHDPGRPPGEAKVPEPPRAQEPPKGPENPSPAPALKPAGAQRPADLRANPIATPEPEGDPVAEYRAAYRALKDRDPVLARKYPNPDEPGRNIDAATILKQLRAEPGGVTTDRPGDLHS